MSDGTLAVALGRSFADLDVELEPVSVPTPYGNVQLHRAFGHWVLFRHGRPHTWLPHQIPFRAHALALREVGVQSLVSTGTVALFDDNAPLFRPMLAADVAMDTGLLPDGTPASIFVDGVGPQGHLSLDEGIVSPHLNKMLRGIATMLGSPLDVREVDIWHVAGPRQRTNAENRALAAAGVEAVSMTLVPEMVLANELGISTTALVVGHRSAHEPLSASEVERRLAEARQPLETLCVSFLRSGHAIASGNTLFRFGGET
ncbi:MAG: hypothetical protein R3F61_36990 [Myxococcota bacterium]